MSKTTRAKCLEAAQKLARLQESDDNGYCQCWSCGVIKHYKEMDGGHFIPKGKGGTNMWALDLRNIHPQCKGCNGFQMKHGNAAQRYTVKMIKTYGIEFVEILTTQNKVVKYSEWELEEMLKDLKSQIKLHEKRIG